MGLHLVPLAKLKLLSANHGTSPLITALVLPFILKIPFIRNTRRVYTDVFEASRLFFFRLSLIIYGDEPSRGGGHRWERALRLVRERIANTRFTESQQEDSLHVATMLAL